MDRLDENEMYLDKGRLVHCSVLYPLSTAGMTLRIWPGSLYGKVFDVGSEDYYDVELGYGKYIIFRGDLLHAGVYYGIENYRGFFYIYLRWIVEDGKRKEVEADEPSNEVIIPGPFKQTSTQHGRKVLEELKSDIQKVTDHNDNIQW